MFEKRRQVRELEKITAQYSLYPFEDLDDGETRRQAREYLASRSLLPIPGESEYVVRSMLLPDRRHTFPDQRLWMRLHEHTWEMNDEDKRLLLLLQGVTETAVANSIEFQAE